MSTKTNEPKVKIVDEKIEAAAYAAAVIDAIITTGVCALAYNVIRFALGTLNDTAE